MKTAQGSENGLPARFLFIEKIDPILALKPNRSDLVHKGKTIPLSRNGMASAMLFPLFAGAGAKLIESKSRCIAHVAIHPPYFVSLLPRCLYARGFGWSCRAFVAAACNSEKVVISCFSSSFWMGGGSPWKNS
jgi:hypothetical protein